jgi:hypothetical protein
MIGQFITRAVRGHVERKSRHGKPLSRIVAQCRRAGKTELTPLDAHDRGA